jgi:hypothetical protein
MNKRIEELSEQAMQYAEHLHGRFHEGHEDPNWDTFVAFQQKFAELIIQECIDVVIDCDESPKMILHEPYRTIMNRIDEHFGVEE